MKSLNQLQLYLVPVASLIVVVALIPLVIMPQLDRIASASKTIGENRTRLEKVKAKADALEDLAENKDDLEADLNFIETVLPVEKAIAPLIFGVQQIARDQGLAVTKIRLAPGKTATASATPQSDDRLQQTQNNQSSNGEVFSSKDSLVFELTLSGDINAFKNYLSTLEKAKRILFLNKFEAEESQGEYKVTFFINAPYGRLPSGASDRLAQELKKLSPNNEKLLEDLKSEIFQDVTDVQIPEVPTGTEPNPFRNIIP